MGESYRRWNPASKRQYFWLEARPGTEITFLTESSKERKKAKLKNYSAGGVAFFMENDWKLNVGNWLTEVNLKVPEGEGMIRFQIPKAAVRRVELESSYRRQALCAIEFTEYPGRAEITSSLMS